MITAQQIRDVYEKASSEFAASASYRHLLGGQADADEVRDFIRNVFLTHYLSSHIVALCFASLPSDAASLLKENLLEEMGRSEAESRIPRCYSNWRAAPAFPSKRFKV